MRPRNQCPSLPDVGAIRIDRAISPLHQLAVSVRVSLACGGLLIGSAPFRLQDHDLRAQRPQRAGLQP